MTGITAGTTSIGSGGVKAYDYTQKAPFWVE